MKETVYTVKVDEFGNTRWYNKEGRLHREDGPAIEHSDGVTKLWFLEGYHYSEQDFVLITQKTLRLRLSVSDIEKLFGCKVKIVD